MHTSYNIYKPSTNLINFNIMFRNIWIWKLEILNTFTPKKTIQYGYDVKTSNKNNKVFNN